MPHLIRTGAGACLDGTTCSTHTGEINVLEIGLCSNGGGVLSAGGRSGAGMACQRRCHPGRWLQSLPQTGPPQGRRRLQPANPSNPAAQAPPRRRPGGAGAGRQKPQGSWPSSWRRAASPAAAAARAQPWRARMGRPGTGGCAGGRGTLAGQINPARKGPLAPPQQPWRHSSTPCRLMWTTQPVRGHPAQARTAPCGSGPGSQGGARLRTATLQSCSPEG